MTDAIVSFLVGEISAFLKEETKLLGAVRGDVEFICHELEHMKAFLRAAEGMIDEPADSQVSIWVKEVRDIAFDIEDTLDEYRLRFRSDRRGTTNMGMISRFFKNLKHKHEIASQIQGLKSRIIDASGRRQRYQLNIPEEVQRSAAASSIVSEQRNNALLLEEDEVVGLEDSKRPLLDWILREDSVLKVISVAGMGGLGKTTLVKKVYEDAFVQKLFKIRVWVTVSQSFKMEELLKKIIQQIIRERNQQIPEGMETMENHDLKQVIKNFFGENRFLLVVDDIWDEAVWNSIKHALPGSKQGSRVILTTRNDKVAIAPCADFKSKVHKMEPLSSELSWKLFCNKTFHEDQCPQHLNGIAKFIVEKCHGLPIAIVAVSGVLATKSSTDEWEMVSQNLSDEFQSDKLLSVKRILLLSYTDLPFNLKACMLLISMTPEDYRINRFEFVNMWIAEGFVEERNGKTLKEVAYFYFNELVNRSLIQVVDPLKRFFVIHDLLREVILSKAIDQNFAAIVTEKSTRWPENARRLSFHTTLGNIPYSGQRCRFRSLLVFAVDDFSFPSLATHLRLLKVLHLSQTNLEVFPNEITYLYYLRYLDLRYTKIKEIPSSIGRLQNMQYLNLKDTNVTSLPRTILKLQQLRFLAVGRWLQSKWHGFAGFPGIECLTCIQTLNFIEVNVKGGIDVVQELGKLTQLKDVGIAGLKKEHGPTLCSSIEKLKGIEKLYVCSTDEEEILDVQNVSFPPKFLKYLHLIGRLDKLPSWIQFLHSLTYLYLGGSRLKDSILEAIQDLPNLIKIELSNASQEDDLCFKAGAFQKLKTLVLENLGALQKVEVEKGSMPCLEELNIANCPSMKNVPFGVEHLSKLRSVTILKMSDELICKILPGGKDFWRLEHVPRVVVPGGHGTH